jgi:hypothetical protein
MRRSESPTSSSFAQIRSPVYSFFPSEMARSAVCMAAALAP